MSPVEPRCAAHFLTTPSCANPARSTHTPTLAPDVLLDTFFARIHGKPYYVLDETTTRQRLQANQLPSHLAYAIYAVTARYAEPLLDV
jgi:hypothetical protein